MHYLPDREEKTTGPEALRVNTRVGCQTSPRRLRPDWGLCGLIAFVFVLLGLSVPSPALATKDTRIALLIANQVGWAREPKLQYVISGDLRPMAKRLKKLGFQIHAVLANRDPNAIRRAWKSVLKRLRQKPRVTTFFFYYSGHADKTHFHTGPRNKNPLSYRELATFLGQVKVRRRFVLLDACFSGALLRQFGSMERYKTLMQKGELYGKGIEQKLFLTDLRKHFPKKGEQVRGLQILSSSRYLSYESRRRRGSVFTYHFLRGLDGRADLDRDGKISFNELFLYAKPKVHSETGQNPQQWLFRVGGDTYGFAPVYNSILELNPALHGRFRVQVKSFVWRWNKKRKRRLRIAVPAGKGMLVWRHKQRCKRQHLLFPSRQTITPQPSRWISSNCRDVGFVQKGKELTQLPLQTKFTGFLDTWMLEVQGGIFGTNGWLDMNGDLGSLGWFGVRHRHFGLLLGVGGSQSRFPASGVTGHLLLSLRAEGGLRHHWGKVDLFTGPFLQVGVLFQDLVSNTNPLLSLALQGGLTVTLGYWVHERFSLFFAADAGVIPRFSTLTPRLHFTYGFRVGLRFSNSKSTNHPVF